MEKFKLGQLVATRGVSDRMQHDLAFAAFVSKSIRRYKECDWGDSPKDIPSTISLSISYSS